MRDAHNYAESSEDARHADVHDVKKQQSLVAGQRTARSEAASVAGDARLALRLRGMLLHRGKPAGICVIQCVGQVSQHSIFGVHERAMDELVAHRRFGKVLPANDRSCGVLPANDRSCGDTELASRHAHSCHACLARARLLCV